MFLPKSDLVEKLKLRKGFAFFDFNEFHQRVSQADVYFTIAMVLHNLRYADKNTHCLRQSEFVRNIIDPSNFNRYNDGIIQASILRAAQKEELAYKLDNEVSLEMKGILETIIKYPAFDQGEAMLEFLYALAVQKMSLRNEHLESICALVTEKIRNQFALLLVEYIRAKVLSLPKSLVEENRALLNENIRLKSELAGLKRS